LFNTFKLSFGNCQITRLKPNTNDKEENYGLTNCSIRLHLGVVCDTSSSVPPFVLVNKRKRLLIENKHVIMYNDALQHSFINQNQSQQIMLTLDLWHPDLSPIMRTHLTSIFNSDLA